MVLAELGHSEIQNRPLLDSKTEFNGIGGLRAHISFVSVPPPVPALLNFGPGASLRWGRFF